ncbi:SpoIIAA-like protein [Sinobacterium caligoides]|uniref:SpoIIAA-like protein n=2 Tax=Sinobacterium caligoides TaxID=933926 RepID=A0A3N2DKC6_9GAMM|nr:SpoIIAA-like protein [Sinobacterium caligoides]
MLEMIDIGIDRAVAFQMSGKITEEDMQRVLAEARGKISQHGSIVMLEQIDSFSGIELSALVEEFKYLIHVGLKDITKVAVLTDKRWVEKVVSIEDKIFRGIDIKSFAIEDKAQAIAFLNDN